MLNFKTLKGNQLSVENIESCLLIQQEIATGVLDLSVEDLLDITSNLHVSEKLEDESQYFKNMQSQRSEIESDHKEVKDIEEPKNGKNSIQLLNQFTEDNSISNEKNRIII